LQYAVDRNIASERLTAQRIYGVPNLPILQIPVALMQERLIKINKEINADWKLIKVNGGAGAGKTELVSLFVADCSKQTKDFFLYCNQSEIYQALESPDSYKSSKLLMGILADFIVDPQTKIDISGSNHDYLDSSMTPHKDALLNRLERKFGNIVMIIDDLESNGELADVLAVHHNLLMEWGIKMILVSRSVIPGIKEGLTINLPLWNRREATAILSDWNAD
jgi:hypothetical protein